MSTVMYCYNLPKTKLWEFRHSLVEFLTNPANNLMPHVLPHNLAKRIAERQITHSEAYNLLQELGKDNEYRLQLFDLALYDPAMGDYWLMRVLESGFLFSNNNHRWSGLLTTVFYDDRSDMAPGEALNKSIAEWVDTQINLKQYLVVDVITLDYLTQEFFQAQLSLKVAK